MSKELDAASVGCLDGQMLLCRREVEVCLAKQHDYRAALGQGRMTCACEGACLKKTNAVCALMAGGMDGSESTGGESGEDELRPLILCLDVAGNSKR